MHSSTCPICGKSFTSPKPRIFCSIQCRNINNASTRTPRRIQQTCLVCGKIFFTRPTPDGSPRHLCCSNKCGRIQGGKTYSKQAAPVEHTCPICGKVFSDNPARARTYCSRKCMSIGFKEVAQEPRICDFCHKPFTVPQYISQRFCSQGCKGKGIAQEKGQHIRQQVTFTCEHCGKPFTYKARADREYHFCSRQCYWAERRGENHHCWQGGTSRYYGPNWDEQRVKALERDSYTCQECGIAEDGMNVHHITLRSEFDQDWQAMNDLSNLTTLCHSCHARLHIDHLNG